MNRINSCTFDGCIVELREPNAYLHGNTFTDCQLVGAGWPPSMSAVVFK